MWFKNTISAFALAIRSASVDWSTQQWDAIIVGAGPDANVYYSNPQYAKNIASFIFKIFQKLPSSGLNSLNLAQNSSQAQIEQYITTPSAYARGQVNHWSNSCRIVKCVDSKTIVKGMSNLHVVYGSAVAPLTVNPQLGIMAAAERASELILGLMGNDHERNLYCIE